MRPSLSYLSFYILHFAKCFMLNSTIALQRTNVKECEKDFPANPLPKVTVHSVPSNTLRDAQNLC